MTASLQQGTRSEPEVVDRRGAVQLGGGREGDNEVQQMPASLDSPAHHFTKEWTCSARASQGKATLDARRARQVGIIFGSGAPLQAECC